MSTTTAGKGERSRHFGDETYDGHKGTFKPISQLTAGLTRTSSHEGP